MDKVTQSNAAISEQSAASSDELKAQAEQVQNAVAELMCMVDGGGMEIDAAAQAIVSPTLNRGGASNYGRGSMEGRTFSASGSVPRNRLNGLSNGRDISNGSDGPDRSGRRMGANGSGSSHGTNGNGSADSDGNFIDQA